MAIRRLKCRDHNGIFTIITKRGKQPVRCTPANLCDRATTITINGQAKTIVKSGAPPVETLKEMKERTSPIGIPVSHANTMLGGNPSLTLAKAAKERLEAVGWVCQGKAGFGSEHDAALAWASLTCSRDGETLIMNWFDGELVAQDYSMFHVEPRKNNIPENKLHFDPEEMTDSELVRLIKGMKVTWWNTIAGAEEKAVVGGTVTVEHIFFANGDEDNSKRIVKFLDHGGGGFRAFHVGALLKVG